MRIVKLNGLGGPGDLLSYG